MLNDPLLVLSLARMRFLHTPEKLLLFDVAGSAENLSMLTREDASRIIGRTLRTDRWDPAGFLAAAEEDLLLLSRREIAWVFYWDERYPPVLREIFDPPFTLFFRGNLPDRDGSAVGVVGTRKPTGRATGAAYDLGFDFALNCIPVISGLARGIDRAAHEGAVKAGGKTFAVLGCGIDTVYPKENRRLAESVLKAGGGLLSEYSPCIPPLQYHFPERNRIISGLSRAVVVVEAPLKSGALITSDFALEQGRDVYIHAAGAGDAESSGTGRLAIDGAPVINGARDVLSDWGFLPERIRVRSEHPEFHTHPDKPGLSLSESLANELGGMGGRAIRGERVS